MRATATRLLCAICAVGALACNRQQPVESSIPPNGTPRETVGTSGRTDEPLTLTGCLTRLQPDGFVLTSSDAGMSHPKGTTGQQGAEGRDIDVNRSKRVQRHENLSTDSGRYRLEGDMERIAMLVNHEVEVSGRFEPGSAGNGTQATVRAETIDATGPTCGRR
jgi:hypothetical protein